MKQFRAVSIDTDGVATVHDWDVTHGTLKHLQEAVGGFVDVVVLAADMDMWVNDEGLVIGLPINETATAIAHQHGMKHQFYVGPAVFTGGCNEEGDTLPLTEEQAATITALCTALATA